MMRILFNTRQEYMKFNTYCVFGWRNAKYISHGIQANQTSPFKISIPAGNRYPEWVVNIIPHSGVRNSYSLYEIGVNCSKYDILFIKFSISTATQTTQPQPVLNFSRLLPPLSHPELA